MLSIDDLQDAVTFIRKEAPFRPQVGLQMGSGLASFVKELEIIKKIDYRDIPHFGSGSKEIQGGAILFAKSGSTSLVALQGRQHYHDRLDIHAVVFPVRVLALLGLQTLIATNSCGGLQDKMQEGELLLIEDHLNLMGANPLAGPRVQDLGPKLPDTAALYDPKLLAGMEATLQELGYPFHKGTYAALTGPTYETPAEVRLLKTLGCAGVGTSLVPEVLAAAHLGVRVAAVSCITNLPSLKQERKASNEELGWTARRVESQFSRFMKSFLERL